MVASGRVVDVLTVLDAERVAVERFVAFDARSEERGAVFVFGGYFGGCLKVARGRPSVWERERKRGSDGATESAQGRARGQVLRQTGLSSEGLGGIGRVQGGPWLLGESLSIEVGQALGKRWCQAEGERVCIDRR